MTISEDGEIVGITAENKPITIEISKQDVYGERTFRRRNGAYQQR